jgi:hypothetical protein
VTGTKRPVGRPRDPDVEARAYAAALQVYARDGLAGFSYEVPRRTGHGRDDLFTFLLA